MQTVFLLCIGLGGLVLLSQVVLGLFGLDTDVPELDLPDVDAPAGDLGGSEAVAGLDLLSVRSVSAAVAVYGAAGLWLDGFLVLPLAAVLAVGPALLAAVGVAWLTWLMLRAESSGSLRLDGAVGATGTVYLAVPAGGDGTGLVQFPLQGRTVELKARTRGAEALPPGAEILVVSVDPESETVDVVSTTTIEGLP